MKDEMSIVVNVENLTKLIDSLSTFKNEIIGLSNSLIEMTNSRDFWQRRCDMYEKCYHQAQEQLDKKEMQP